MYTGVVELRKTKIALSSSLTNRGSIPEWCERLMTKLRMGRGCMVGGFRMLRIVGLLRRCWGNRLWPNGKLHESVAYKRADMSLFFPQWAVWGGVGGWERWHPGPHVSLLQSRLPFPQSLSSFHFCPLWFKESTFSRTELPKQNNYVVNGKCLGMTVKAFKTVAPHEVNVNVCLCASKRSAWLPNLMPWPRRWRSLL